MLMCCWQWPSQWRQFNTIHHIFKPSCSWSRHFANTLLPVCVLRQSVEGRLSGKLETESNSCLSHCLSVRFDFSHQRFVVVLADTQHWTSFLAIYSFVCLDLFANVAAFHFPYLKKIYGNTSNNNHPSTPRFCHRSSSFSIKSPPPPTTFWW
jgi:hypothetical protein